MSPAIKYVHPSTASAPQRFWGVIDGYNTAREQMRVMASYKSVDCRLTENAIQQVACCNSMTPLSVALVLIGGGMECPLNDLSAPVQGNLASLARLAERSGAVPGVGRTAEIRKALEEKVFEDLSVEERGKVLTKLSDLNARWEDSNALR